MHWIIRNKIDETELSPTFDSKTKAVNHIKSMGNAFQFIYEAVPDTNNPTLRRMLTEGLVAGDLRRIILPQISVDEYIPGDPNTDNVVIAFFLKGVPEAVIPFRDFMLKCRGVLDVAYGDSDTIPNASIVYVELSRKNFQFDDLSDIMDQVSLLSDLQIEDFSLMFPSSSSKYPYSKERINDYFEHRSAKKNMMAQKQALDKLKNEEDNEKTQTEDMIEFIIEQFGN